MKTIEHHVILYRFCSDSNDEYILRYTTCRYSDFVKEFRRLKDSLSCQILDSYEVYYPFRLVHEKRILSHTAI